MKSISLFFMKFLKVVAAAGFILVVIWFCIRAVPALAITLSATPADIKPGDSVHMAISLYFDPLPPAPDGRAEVNYADGSGWHNLGVGTTPDGVTYYINIDHQYNAVGTYTIRVRYERGTYPSGTPGALPAGPQNPSRTVTVSTFLTFTRIQVYFKDHESKLFVKRNQRGIQAAADFRYEGAGLFKGYWQADDRILAQVIKNLPYANNRTFTLKLPAVPPLPTHATGSHRLRFVITEPPMNITFPSVIYVVAGEDLVVRHPISLVSPAKGATLSSGASNFPGRENPEFPVIGSNFLLRMMIKK